MLMDTHTISFLQSPSPSRQRRSSKFSLSSFSINSIRWNSPLSVLPKNPNLMSKSSSLSLSLSSSMASVVQATAFSATCASSEELGTTSGIVGQNDLLIVGPGVLGRLVAQQWRQEHPGCQVYGQTVTMDHHNELIQMGINPTMKGTMLPHKFPYVIFCAPPSRSQDYAGNVREAALSWSGEGSFVFTSSSALYDCSDNGHCDEETPVVSIGRSPRTDVLLKAENVVLEFGGCVLRLAGLFKADRGAHMYWLKQVKSELRPNHVVNQIHYEDAASLAVAILKTSLRGRVFLGCDNHSLSRQEIMDLVNRSGKFNQRFEGFIGTHGPLGKSLNNAKTREEIGWKPKYPSFAQFLEEL